MIDRRRHNNLRWSLLLIGFLTSTGIMDGPWLCSAERAPSDPPNGLTTCAVGVTRKGTSIACWVQREDLDLATPKFRILLVGGLAGDAGSAELTRQAVHTFHTRANLTKWRERFLISAVPNVHPDGVPATVKPAGKAAGGGESANRAGGFPPPPDAFYHTPANPESAYLWRWVGMFAPDLVVDVRQGDALAWYVPGGSYSGWRDLPAQLESLQRGADDELVAQLQRVAPCETGLIPALRVAAVDPEFLPLLLEALTASGVRGPSPARVALQRRLDRTPLQVAEQLSQHYGHALSQVAYIPAMALVARVRLSELTGAASHRKDVEQIVAPYVEGQKPTKPDNGSALPGHLIFCELAERSSGAARSRYIELARAAADLAFDAHGQPRESMPFHLEMSDSLFMGGPILAHVGALTGEERYFEACLKHLRFMRKLCLRPDGIYRHSPLDETAWGRGNGFPALGVTLCLSKFPADHPGRAELLGWLQAHLRALLPHQDLNGCWHQVIDHPASYRELTATCMIGFALARGVREGWLAKAEFEPAIERAWYAVKTRAPADGRLVDVCTGTGKQKSLREYYDRPAILGPDDRGGAMVLLFATELGQSNRPR